MATAARRLARPTASDTMTPHYGAIAQLGERVVRNDEVRSSILLGSTTFPSKTVRPRLERPDLGVFRPFSYPAQSSLDRPNPAVSGGRSGGGWGIPSAGYRQGAAQGLSPIPPSARPRDEDWVGRWRPDPSPEGGVDSLAPHAIRCRDDSGSEPGNVSRLDQPSQCPRQGGSAAAEGSGNETNAGLLLISVCRTARSSELKLLLYFFTREPYVRGDTLGS